MRETEARNTSNGTDVRDTYLYDGVQVLSPSSWWFGEGGTPVLIPNTAVKPFSAEGTPQGGE